MEASIVLIPHQVNHGFEPLIGMPQEFSLCLLFTQQAGKLGHIQGSPVQEGVQISWDDSGCPNAI